MPPALSKPFLGLPRWAWLLVVAGGVTIGIILRQRQSEQDAIDAAAADTADSTDPSSDPANDFGPYSDQGFMGDPGYVLTPTAYGNPQPSGVGDTTIITVQGQVPCTDPKPSRPAAQGHKWVCQNGQWVQTPKSGDGGGDGGGDGHGHGDGHHGHGGGHHGGGKGHGGGHRQGGRHGGQGGGRGRGGGRKRAAPIQSPGHKITGGGPPIRPDAHRPINA